ASLHTMPAGESYLVVGGCGFLGRHIVEQLLARGETEVAVFDIVQRHFDNNVTFYIGDISKPEDVRNALEKSRATAVIHTASPAHNLGPEIYQIVNVKGTRNIIDECLALSVKKLVYTSSGGVVYNGESDIVTADERLPYPAKALDAYNETKVAAEKMVLEANGQNGLLTCAIRPAGIFGPGDRQMINGFYGVVKNNQTKFQIGDNSNLADFTYVGNVAHAHLLAANADEDTDGEEGGYPIAGQAFFITNGEPVYFWDFARTVWRQLGHVPPYIIAMPAGVGLILATLAEIFSKLFGKEAGFTRFRVSQAVQNRYYDIEKARRLLGYEPIVSLDEGMRRWTSTRRRQNKLRRRRG
ncbi:ERG26 protein, partial [Spelaeornis formosus]|nr:ERG26 protein [Elachura formosa]